MFLIDNLWKIFEVAREERTDGDNFEGDMTTADDCFVNAVKGLDHYSCLDKYNMQALAGAMAETNMAEAKAEYDAVVNSNPHCKEARKYGELVEAFKTNNVAAFEKAKAQGLEVYYDYLEKQQSKK